MRPEAWGNTDFPPPLIPQTLPPNTPQDHLHSSCRLKISKKNHERDHGRNHERNHERDSEAYQKLQFHVFNKEVNNNHFLAKSKDHAVNTLMSPILAYIQTLLILHCFCYVKRTRDSLISWCNLILNRSSDLTYSSWQISLAGRDTRKTQVSDYQQLTI